MIKKIMVVDDDPDIALSVKRGLEGLGEDFEVTCVSSGIDCIETLKNNQVPDLILLDIMMPGLVRLLEKLLAWITLKSRLKLRI